MKKILLAVLILTLLPMVANGQHVTKITGLPEINGWGHLERGDSSHVDMTALAESLYVIGWGLIADGDSSEVNVTQIWLDSLWNIIFNMVDTTAAKIPYASSADTTTAAFLHRSGGTVGAITLTGNITMPDNGSIGLGTALVEFLDETEDSIRMWSTVRMNGVYATFLYTSLGINSGNGLTVSTGNVNLPSATIDETEIYFSTAAGGVDLTNFATQTSGQITAGATWGVLDQSLTKSDLDSTSSNFVFDNAYSGTSEIADSEYVTKGAVSSFFATKTMLTDTSWLVRQMLTDTTWDMKNGFVWAGAQDFGTATSFALPHGQNPTTDANTEIAYDTDNQAIEVYDSVLAVSVTVPVKKDKDATIRNPDLLTSSNISFFFVDGCVYPFGIKLLKLAVSQSAAVADTFVLHEYSNRTTYAATIESVVTSAQFDTTGGTMGAIGDSDIAANAWIVIHAANVDVEEVTYKIEYYVKEGD